MSQRKVLFFSENVKYRVQGKRKLLALIGVILSEEKKELGDISIILCNDKRLLKINKEYLQHDYYTDIVTFDYSEMKKVEGDIFISIDRIKDNAKEFGSTVARELNRVAIHGVLHLCGYKDGTRAQKRRMTQREDYYLSLLR